MTNPIGLLFGIVFVGVAVFTIVMLFRNILRGLRSGGRLPYEPIPIIFPPIPVERTPGVVLIGSLAMVWSMGHFSLVVYWALGGGLIPQIGAASLAVAYICLAAVLTGLGGAMLLARRALGRRLISWGLLLLGLLAFFALIMALLLPKYEDAPTWVRRLAMTLAAGMAAHIIFDTIVGMLGQRVGQPADFDEERYIAARKARTDQPDRPAPGIPGADETMNYANGSEFLE